MITTVTLNAAIDKTYYLPNFAIGKVSRVQRMFAEAGGKGINVAKVIQQLGHTVKATGFVGGNNGEFILSELDRQGIEHDFVRVDEESRICLNVIDEATGASTELLETGPTISETAMYRLADKLKELAAQSYMVCLSGSLPKGVPANYYSALIQLVKAEGALVYLDTSGEALRLGVDAAPSFIKPNEEEIIALLGCSSEPADQCLLDPLHTKGVQGVCISLGAAGSMMSYRNIRYRVSAPHIQAVNTVGCGDAFVAGFAVGMAGQLEMEECLRLASATGAANALSERAGHVNKDDVAQLLHKVTVEVI